MFSLSIDDIENSQQCFTTVVLKIADAGWLILLVQKFLQKKEFIWKIAWMPFHNDIVILLMIIELETLPNF